MELQQKAEAIIKRALDGGWNPSPDISVDFKMDRWTESLMYDPNTIAFDHGFARAFFGDTPDSHITSEDKDGNKSTGCMKAKCECKDFIMTYWEPWKFYLQSMVLCEDPLEYLWKFVSEEKEDNS